MDMHSYAGSESKYLKAADLQGKSIKATISYVELVKFEDDKGEKTKPCLQLEGKDKMVVCNATTVTELSEAYGWDSDDWLGKKIGLSTHFYENFGKEGIVVTAIDKPAIEFEEDIIPF